MVRHAEERICLTVTEYARHITVRYLVRGLIVAGCVWAVTPPGALRETDQFLPRPVWWRSRARLAVLELLTERS